MARRSSGEVIALDQVREQRLGPPPAPGVTEPTLRDYLDVVLKWRWLIVAAFVVSVAVAGAFAYRMPRIYRAVATLELSPNAPRYLGNGVQDVAETGSNFYWQTKEFFETQYQVIRSRAVAQRVVDELGLATDAAFLGVEKIADPAERAAIMARADPAGRLQGMINVEPVKDSRIARLMIEDTDPERATRLTNALADAYIEQNLERKLDLTRAATQWLSDQLDDLRVKLESSELELHDFKRRNDILAKSFEDRQAIVSRKLVEFNDTLTRISIHRAELESRARVLEEARQRVAEGDTAALDAVPAVAKSAAVGALRLRLLSLEEELAAARERYLDKHPARIELESKVVEVKQALDTEVRKVLLAAQFEASEAAQTEKNLRSLIAGTEREALALNEHEPDYAKLKREQEQNQRLFSLVLQRLKDAELTGMLRTNSIQVLDAALVPKAPVKPNRKAILLVAGIMGLLVGLGLAFLFEFLDNTIKTHDDVEQVLGLPFLGIVPRMREEKGLSELEQARFHDMYVFRKPKSSVAECIRSVRTNLLFMTPEKPLKRLLVTSSSPREGKTTVATNTAIAMAQAGSRTLLVDTDMRRPRIHRAFGMPNDVGISSVIVGQVKLEDAVRETAVPNLFVLPCGPIPPNPAEIIHTARFKQVLQEMDGRYDRVIFDSPPVGAVADALILASLTDGVVMVCKAGKTLRAHAERTRVSLEDVNARLFGVVINDLDIEKRSYGSYYYYQRYGYYYGEKQDEAEA